MKNITFIFLIISMLCSCSAFKRVKGNEKIIDKDTIEYKIIKPKLDKIEKEEKIVEYDYQYGSDLGLYRTEQPSEEFILSSSIEIIDTLENEPIEFNITNNIDTVLVKEDDIGIIAHNIPPKFKINVYSTIRLRISKSNDTVTIINGNRGISIVPKYSTDEIILESIKIDDKMSAWLYSDDGNTETELVNSNRTQNIYVEGYTEWTWRVKPLNDNPTYIKLIITVSDRDVVVYEKTIPVEGDFWFETTTWLEKWWEVIASTLIIPIVIPIFIYIRRKRKLDKERS